MKEKLLELSEIASSFESKGNIRAGRIVTDAMKKIAQTRTIQETINSMNPENRNRQFLPQTRTIQETINSMHPENRNEQWKLRQLFEKCFTEAMSGNVHAINALNIFTKAYAGAKYDEPQRLFGTKPLAYPANTYSMPTNS